MLTNYKTNLKMSRKIVFVTVGTTKFDDLIKTVTQNEVLTVKFAIDY